MHSTCLSVSTFSSDPDFLLVWAPQEGTVRLPEMSAPFTIMNVKAAFRQAGIEVVVTESVVGRELREVVRLRRQQARDATRQQQQLRQSYESAVLRGATSVAVGQHAECLAKKLEVDEELRQTRQHYQAVCAAKNVDGVRMDRHAFLRLQQRLEQLKQESQALQYRMGELRRQQKEENKQASDNDFRQAARRILSAEQFDQVVQAIADDET